MKTLKVSTAPLFLLICMLFAGGCGYHIAGMGGKMPGGITSLSIPVFANATSKPDIEATITSAFVTEFVNTVSVVDSGEAVLKGVIKSYTLTPISFSKSDINQLYRLTVSLSLKITTADESEVLWEDGNVIDYEDFTVNVADVTATRDREAQALQKMAKDTARLVKERMLENF